MKTAFELTAEFRDDQGKGASRRLRRSAKTPAILYGGKREPRALTLDMAKLQQLLDNEKFYSSIVTLKVGDQKQAAVLRDLQRHPFKSIIMHADFQRVLEDEPIRMLVPLHFLNEAAAPGVKTGGGMVSHLKNELLVECLPKDLPEFIDVDIGNLQLNQSIRISEVQLPAGVQSVDLIQGRDQQVVAIHSQRAEETEAAPAEGAAAAPAAAAAAPAKAAPAKEEKGKK